MDDSKTHIAHLWQELRFRCLELAVKGGATESNMIEVADRLGVYIVTKSEFEMKVTNAVAPSHPPEDVGETR